MTRPLLSLVMIVKDEAATIKAVLEAVRPHVDLWTILDTGSTDGTQQIVRDALAGLPGTLFETAFHGFAGSRNEAMLLAEFPQRATTSASKAADGEAVACFQLMLSGDEYLRNGDKLREYLETQRETDTTCFFMRVSLDDVVCPRPIVFRTGSGWKYDDFDCGVHEVPTHTNPKEPVAYIADPYIDHIAANPLKRLENIWDKHIPLLVAALDRNPQNARAIEYLAMSYEAQMMCADDADKKEFAEQCLSLYRRRFELPFSCDEEMHLFTMRYLDDASFTEAYTPLELFAHTETLYRTCPKVPEVALMRAVFAARVPGVTTSRIYNLAVDAINVANEAAVSPPTSTAALTTSCAWKAHRIAAVAAKQLAAKHPTMADKVRIHVKAGLEAGGPFILFKGIHEAAKTLDSAAPVAISP